MKYFFILIILLLCIGALFGCAPHSQEQEGSAPLGSSAGGVSIDNAYINLKDISITQEQSETVVTLSLISGSRLANYPETKLAQTPEFEITKLDQPQRIKITLHNISFWDYEPKSSWVLSDYVAGLFHEVPANDDTLIVYIQLTKDANYLWQEHDGNLIVRISPDEQSEGIKYYCVSNAFLEHQEGRWPNGINMQPVLCSDRQSKLLISAPFDTREEAQAYKDDMSGVLSAALPEKEMHVIPLPAGTLPEYAIDIDYSVLESRPIIQKDDAVLSTPLLLQNGRYLDAAADGRIAFSRGYKSDEPTMEQYRYLLSECLWVRDTNGRIQSIDIPPFFKIDSAAFSSDGRFIGVLDVSIENRVMYVYDFELQILYNVSEEGLGSRVYAFAWSDTENTLYAVSDGKTPLLMTCSFLQDGDVNVAQKEELSSKGTIAVSGKRTFVTDIADGVVYQAGTIRRRLTSGSDIRVSPDGKMLLVIEERDSISEQLLTSLKLYDIETGEEMVIADDEEIFSFGFSQSSGKVCFTASSDENDSFPYKLYIYDPLSGTLALEALCSTATFANADAPATLYFIDYVQVNAGDGFYATYIYVIN